MEENLKSKNIFIKARVNLPEYMVIKRKMQLLKIEKISDYIREATIFGTLFVFQDFYNLTNEWIRVGKNINQIAHRVNSNPEKLELYSDDLIFIKSQIKKIKMDNEELIKKVFKSFKIK